MTKLLSYDQIAELTAMSKSFVKQAAYRGELGEPIRLGHRRPRFTEEQVRQWIEKKKRGE